MEAGNSVLFFIANSGGKKKDLILRFEQLLKEFKDGGYNGSIALHFSEGYLAKLHSTRVD